MLRNNLTFLFFSLGFCLISGVAHADGSCRLTHGIYTVSAKYNLPKDWKTKKNEIYSPELKLTRSTTPSSEITVDRWESCFTAAYNNAPPLDDRFVAWSYTMRSGFYTHGTVDYKTRNTFITRGRRQNILRYPCAAYLANNDGIPMKTNHGNVSFIDFKLNTPENHDKADEGIEYDNDGKPVVKIRYDDEGHIIHPPIKSTANETQTVITFSTTDIDFFTKVVVGSSSDAAIACKNFAQEKLNEYYDHHKLSTIVNIHWEVDNLGINSKGTIPPTEEQKYRNYQKE